MGGCGSGRKKGTVYKNNQKKGDEYLEIPEGVNSEFLKQSIQIFSMPVFDINNLDDLNQRLLDYFQICHDNGQRATASEFALALGMSRARLIALMNGTKLERTISTESLELIKYGYNLLTVGWEKLMTENKINPIAGIFLGKNNYGFRDQQEHVISTNSNPQDSISSEDLQQKYLADVDIDDD